MSYPLQAQAIPLPYTVRTGCKINAYLRITGRITDCFRYGYHTLDTVFVPLSEPFDTLSFTSAPCGQGLCVSCDAPYVDVRDNTLSRAYAGYASATGFAPDLHIYLEKNVPAGAGLGGGSANAAALLQFLQMYAPKPLSAEALDVVALAVGADVAFFLRNEPCHASGIGDVLTPLSLGAATGMTLPWHGVLVMPAVHVSTAWAYSVWNQDPAVQSTKGASPCQINVPIQATQGAQGGGGVLWFENSFESAVFLKYPELAFLKYTLLLHGARVALLSGSGSSVFGIFATESDAKVAFEEIAKKNIDVQCFCIV